MMRLIVIKNNLIYEDFTETLDREWALLQGGEWVECEQAYNDSWYLKGFAPVQSIEEAKLNKLQEINQAYSKQAELIRNDTPENEVLSWDIQKTEAQAWQKDNQAETPFVDLLAINRGVERDWLINKILEKATAYNHYIASLTGYRQKLEDEIKAATSVAEVEAIVWER